MQTLGDFGHGFQIKLLGLLLKDKQFASRIYDLLQITYFDSESLRWLAKKYFYYFTTYSDVPTLEFFKAEMTDVTDEAFKSELVSNLRGAWQAMSSTDLEYIRTKTLEFCRNQALKAAIIKSVELLKKEEYDEIKRLVDTALQKGQEIDLGVDYVSDLDRRYTESLRSPISTGWSVIDDLCKGGLATGDLGVVIAPSGIGKTWVLSHLGASAVLAGKTVFHYSLELHEEYVGRRYDAIFTGVTMMDLEDNVELIRSKLAKLQGKLHIFHRPEGTLSVVGLSAHIQKMTLAGVKPDLVILDYADLMKLDRSFSREDLALKALYQDLRGLANELGFPMWTASQTNREGTKEEVVEASSVSDSYGKIMTADFIVSISRRLADKASNTARVHVIKNRYGPDGLTFPCTFNTNNGVIKIHDDRTTTGEQVRKAMKEEGSFLATRYDELFKKNPQSQTLEGLL